MIAAESVVTDTYYLVLQTLLLVVPNQGRAAESGRQNDRLIPRIMAPISYFGRASIQQVLFNMYLFHISISFFS